MADVVSAGGLALVETTGLLHGTVVLIVVYMTDGVEVVVVCRVPLLV